MSNLPPTPPNVPEWATEFLQFQYHMYQNQEHVNKVKAAIYASLWHIIGDEEGYTDFGNAARENAALWRERMKGE